VKKVECEKLKVKRAALLIVTVGLLTPSAPRAQQPPPSPVILAPTNHPRLPRDLSQLWMAPEPAGSSRTSAQREFVMGVKLEVDGNFAKALPVFQQSAFRQGPLARYAEYYAALALLRLGRPDEGRRAFQALQAREPVGYLTEAAAMGEAECDEAMGDRAAELSVYQRLARTKTIATDIVLMRLAHAARLAGHPEQATEAYARVYYEYPLSDYALSAGAELTNGSVAGGPTRYTLGLERAERLFNAKRYGQARSEFETLRAISPGEDRELVDLRIAECDYYLKRARNAKTALRPYIERASRQSEALFFYAVSLRDLNEIDEYLQTIQRIATRFPAEKWADEALNDLATYYIRHDEDEKADAVLRDLYGRFPVGRNAEHAAWKIGWTAFRKGNDAEVTRVFERASADFPRSDYRPMWLYWAGRAHERLQETDLATARYTLEVTDYANTYYGRMAMKRLDGQGARPPLRRLVVDVNTAGLAAETGSDAPPPVAVSLPPNAATIRALLSLDLYDQAIDELHYAQAAWGNSSAIEATLAWTFWQQGAGEKGTDQFTHYRGAINAMKRAYPHYLAAGGEELPDPLLKIIFPIAYWDAIRKYAALYNLDPYLSAALISQESTFVPDIKSYANAWGLTQLLPSTARQYAKVVNLRYTTKLLTDPDANLNIGMAYFAAKIREFGAVHLALASYNAGERPVHRWIMERPGVPDDEFIDDIPYPQTNNYVKKILGTAEDYRRLYGAEVRRPASVVAEVTPAAASKAPSAVPAKVSAGTSSRKVVTPTKAATPKKKKARKAA
jgi:soluble lytic murein transglycosylase